MSRRGRGARERRCQARQYLQGPQDEADMQWQDEHHIGSHPYHPAANVMPQEHANPVRAESANGAWLQAGAASPQLPCFTCSPGQIMLVVPVFHHLQHLQPLSEQRQPNYPQDTPQLQMTPHDVSSTHHAGNQIWMGGSSQAITNGQCLQSVNYINSPGTSSCVTGICATGGLANPQPRDLRRHTQLLWQQQASELQAMTSLLLALPSGGNNSSTCTGPPASVHTVPCPLTHHLNLRWQQKAYELQSTTSLLLSLPP